METIYYSPVIIPTLNRYEHFKRCLDSLELCTGAEKTDVYVGLDYPPSEKYIEGWRLIDEYLKKKERKNGFLNLYVRRRDHNCGIGKPNSNAALLIDEVTKNADRYIVSEDDNEFSPNFLEFVNKGLELYKDNPRVMAISGYNYVFNIQGLEKNAYPGYNFSAWGVGIWRDKHFMHKRLGTSRFIDMVLSSYKTSWAVYRNNPVWFNGLMEMNFKKDVYGDTLKCTEFLLYNKVSIFPKISKVRNWGSDGTGLHSKINTKMAEQKIDDSISFDFDEGVIEQTAVNFLPYLKPKLYKWIGAFVRYMCFRMFHKDLFKLFMK